VATSLRSRCVSSSSGSTGRSFGAFSGSTVWAVPITSRYPRLQKKLRDAVLDTPVAADATIRAAAHSGAGLAEPLSGYVEKLRRHAYRVQDSDIESFVPQDILKTRYSR